MAVYARTDRYPERIWVSKPWEPEALAWQNAWLDVEDGSGEPISAIYPMGNYLMIVKKGSVWALEGEYPDQLTLSLVSQGVGTEANRSLIEAQGMLYMWGRNGPSVWDGQKNIPIGEQIPVEVAKGAGHEDGIIGVSDPKRHRVGWLVPMHTVCPSVEWSVILWWDYVWQAWAKDEPHQYMVGIDRVNEGGLDQIYLTDDNGYIHRYDVGNDDAHEAHWGTQNGTTTITTGTISEGVYNFPTTWDGLVGLPVLVYGMIGGVTGYYIEEIESVTDVNTIELVGNPTYDGDVDWWLGPIQFFLERRWTDWSAPTRMKQFRRFFLRPEAYNQTFLTKIAVVREMGEFTSTPTYHFQEELANGMFQFEVWELGLRAKWRVENYRPNSENGLLEAGWEGAILPGGQYEAGHGTTSLYT